MRYLCISVAILLAFSSTADGQGGGKSQGSPNSNTSSQSSQSSGGGTGSLPGYSWAQDSWRTKLMMPPTDSDSRLVCFRLVYTYSATQPFLLEPMTVGPKEAPIVLGGRTCDRLDAKTPLMMRERLVIGIDASAIWSLTRLRLLNINLTNQQGNVINPTPVRPSFAGGAPSAGTTSAAIDRGPFFLTWPLQMPGDVIPTISINTVYTPPTPGAPWETNTFYPVGSIVVPPLSGQKSTLNGHYYVALQAGISWRVNSWPKPSALETVQEPTGVKLTWKDVTPPPAAPPQCGSSPKTWQPNTVFVAGSCIASTSSHLWIATVGGVSAAGAEPLPLVSAHGDLFTESTTLTWLDSGTAAPPSPARQWLRGAPHIVGDVIVNPGNGHFYTAIQGGVASADEPPSFPITQFETIQEDARPQQVADGSEGLLWQPFGTQPPRRKAGTPYPHGTFVFADDSRHFYIASQDDPAGTLDATKLPKSGDAKTLVLAGDSIRDGDVMWKDVGGSPDVASLIWQSKTKYWGDSVVYSKQKAQYYIATSTGQLKSGDKEPDFPEIVGVNRIIWQDAGTAVPAAVASPQPADQLVNMLTIAFPQSHVVSTYNLAAGVVTSTLRNPTFAVNNTGAQPQGTVQTGSSRIVDPVLLLTAYWLGHWFPMDAESAWRPRDLIPGLTFGLSLSSPSTNFYLGGSSEFFLRNVQLVYGVSVAKIAQAAPGSNGSSPSTRQQFKKGAFMGLTFNTNGFIQGLFGGGGGAGKSGGQ